MTAAAERAFAAAAAWSIRLTVACPRARSTAAAEFNRDGRTPVQLRPLRARAPSQLQLRFTAGARCARVRWQLRLPFAGAAARARAGHSRHEHACQLCIWRSHTCSACGAFMMRALAHALPCRHIVAAGFRGWTPTRCAMPPPTAQAQAGPVAPRTRTRAGRPGRRDAARRKRDATRRGPRRDTTHLRRGLTC